MEHLDAKLNNQFGYLGLLLLYLRGAVIVLLAVFLGADFISSINSKTSFYLKIVAAVVLYLGVYSIGLYIYLSSSNFSSKKNFFKFIIKSELTIRYTLLG
uniref:Uncharacterized protein n=1 Tax=Meloidogyne enterolobii TaxID=390850 RepID=A0A6V7VQ66_MELEN|nr:unnamed protein product [Meloidogyne enterolobii]